MLKILENHDYPLVFNIDRKVPAIVTLTLFLLSIIGTIVILTGCTEVYLEDANDYVVPHIVTIDPPIQEFTREEAEAHDIYAFEYSGGSIPLSFIHLPRGEPHTITITFSSPPEDVTIAREPGYELRGQQRLGPSKAQQLK